MFLGRTNIEGFMLKYTTSVLSISHFFSLFLYFFLEGQGTEWQEKENIFLFGGLTYFFFSYITFKAGKVTRTRSNFPTYSKVLISDK